MARLARLGVLGRGMVGEGITRKLAAVLAADVADYTRLMRDDEERTLAAWWHARKDVIDPGIATHSGRIDSDRTSGPAGRGNTDGDFALYLTGDLEGCLKISPKRFECDELNGFDKYTEWGREVFVGTLNGVGWGKFRTRYIVEGIYETGFCDLLADDDASNDGDAFALQLAGGCDHTVIGKSGVFRGVDGLITFLDFIPDPLNRNGASNFFYSGYLNLENHYGR